VLEATWPPAARHRAGPWVLRDGAGGGKRVSAATAEGPVTAADLARRAIW
jgi:N-acetylglutamate synthase